MIDGGRWCQIHPDAGLGLLGQSFLFIIHYSIRSYRAHGGMIHLKFNVFYPPASKVSREVANLTERKNPHTPVYGVKEFVRLSVTNFDPNYLGTGRVKSAEIF